MKDAHEHETFNTVLTFVNARSWAEARSILEAQHDVLFDDSAKHADVLVARASIRRVKVGNNLRRWSKHLLV